MSTHDMESKIRELRSLQRLIEEAQQEADAIRDTIKAQLTAQGVDELQAGEYRVSWKPVSTTRIDTKAFQQAFPEVAQAFSKTTTTRRFCMAQERPLPCTPSLS